MKPIVICCCRPYAFGSLLGNRTGLLWRQVASYGTLQRRMGKDEERRDYSSGPNLAEILEPMQQGLRGSK